MKKVIAFALAFVIVFALGIHIGHNQAIKEAYLIEANEDVYYIEFNGEVHEYDYE